jgi:DNA-binding GntR family transcriptional regulator
VHAEHMKLIDAVERRDAESAILLLRDHVHTNEMPKDGVAAAVARNH